MPIIEESESGCTHTPFEHGETIGETPGQLLVCGRPPPSRRFCATTAKQVPWQGEIQSDAICSWICPPIQLSQRAPPDERRRDGPRERSGNGPARDCKACAPPAAHPLVLALACQDQLQSLNACACVGSSVHASSSAPLQSPISKQADRPCAGTSASPCLHLPHTGSPMAGARCTWLLTAAPRCAAQPAARPRCGATGCSPARGACGCSSSAPLRCRCSAVGPRGCA